MEMKDAIDIRQNTIPEGKPSVSGAIGRSLLSFSFKFLFTTIYIGALASCIKDDRSDCVEETTLTVLFEYLLPDSTERFQRYIDNVDLYIFDAHKNLYDIIPVDKSSLMAFRGITTAVEPGDYYLVAWGNTLYASSGYTGDSYTEMALSHNPAAATTGPLYYAPDLRPIREGDTDDPYRITVIQNENNVHTLPFMGAHHTVEIYVKGMSEDDVPDAELSGMAAGYDYSLGLLASQTIRFTSQTEPIEVEGDPVFFASFCVPHLDDHLPVTAAVVTGDNISGSVVVQQYIEEQELEVTDGNPTIIPILFEYTDGTFVRVSFPGWMQNDVTGGF